MAESVSGGSMLSWQPDLGTRIVLVPRSGGPAAVAELGPLWAWHFANAYEDGGQVIADFPCWSELSMAAGDRHAAGDGHAPVTGRLVRVTVDPARGTAALTDPATVPNGLHANWFPRRPG